MGGRDLQGGSLQARRDRALLAVLLYHGLRRDEVARLTDREDPDKLLKIPTRVEWQLRRMKPETALAHLRRPPDRPRVVRYGVGIIPRSLEAIAADLDAGDRREFWATYGEPWVWLETRRGSHSFYFYAPGELTGPSFAPEPG